MIVLTGVVCVVVKAVAVKVSAVSANDVLPLLRSHERDEFRGRGLRGRGARRLTKAVIGIDQHRVAPEENLQVGEFFFSGHPGTAVGHEISPVRVGLLQGGHHEILGHDVPVTRRRDAGFLPDRHLLFVGERSVCFGKIICFSPLVSLAF